MAAVVALAAALLVLPGQDEDFEYRGEFEQHLRTSKDHFVCAGYGYIDLGAAHDAPAYYFREDSRSLVGMCGGACMFPNAACRMYCPPPGWEAQGCEEKYHAWLSQRPRRP